MRDGDQSAPGSDGPPPTVRVLPELTPENTFFWTSGRDGTLRFLRCQQCASFVHPVASRCRRCEGTQLVPEPVSGRGAVYAYTVNHQEWVPGATPYAIAIVQLDEQDDLRMTSNVVGCPVGELHTGMRLQVRFEEVEDVWLPLFEPER